MWTLFIVVLLINTSGGGGAATSVETHQFQSEQTCRAAATAMTSEGVVAPQDGL